VEGLLYQTSRFWPRVRARALRAPVFVSSFSPKTGRCAPPCPSQLRCFSFDSQKYIKSMELGPLTSEAMKYEVPCPRPPIAASLILPAIFWGQNYVPVRPYAPICFGFSFFIYGSFWIFSFCYSLIFLPSFFLFISSNPSLLISSYSSRRYYSSSSYSSLLIL
jgi:hypothetical protein